MKKIIFLFIIIAGFSLLLSSCNEARKKSLDRLLKTESGEYENEKVSKERIEELEEAIKEYTKDVERVIKANAEIGVYYRMLALEYIDMEMYHMALENLKEAMEYYPGNPVLNYYSGLVSANIAKAEPEDNKRILLYGVAERYYLSAVRLRSGYIDALYALSIIYLFELEQPFMAEPLLEQIISKSPKNWEAKFLYAGLKVIAGDTSSAIDLYDEISKHGWDDDMKQQAVINRDSLLKGGI